MWTGFLCSLSVLLTLQSTAQSTEIAGAWRGVLFNDTTLQYLPFELLIESNGKKMSGHTSTIFYANNQAEIGIRSVDARWRNGKLVIEDDELIFNSFSIPPPRGIRKLMVVELQQTDSGRILTGRWMTNRTRQYAPATGSVIVREITESKSLYVTKFLDSVQVVRDQAKLAKQEAKKPAPPKETPPTEKKSEVSAVAASTPTKKPSAEPTAKPAAASIASRTTQANEYVAIYTDSLELTLYDNGEVDGDTVSVMLNGQLIFAQEGLSIKPVQKRIALPNTNSDTLQLILYAENLGSIPPNTGLLILQDGANRHELRFRADLTTNAVIQLVRKRKTD